MSERKKISELTELAALTGEENLLLGVTGGNKRATVETLKRYVGMDIGHTVPLFAELVDNSVTIVEGTATEEEGAVLDIAYIVRKQTFAQRKTVNGASSYFSEWADMTNYQTDGTPRVDRVFYCMGRATLYVWDGTSLAGLVGEDIRSLIGSVAESVTEETVRATAAEEALLKAVTEETVRAQKAEQANEDAITALQSAIGRWQASTEEEINDMIANSTWQEGVFYYATEG